MKLGPTPPNSFEMLNYLVRKGTFSMTNISYDQLKNDAYIKIISSACNEPVEKIIQTLQVIVKNQ